MTQGEHSSQTNEPRRDLDECLSAYYGPALPELPLPVSSWSQLSAQLGPQQHRRSTSLIRARRRHFSHMRDYRLPPLYIQTAYSRIVSEAGLSSVPGMLACRFDLRVRSPELRLSLFSRRHIRLKLPLDARDSMAPSALDVLLATALARYILMRKPAYMLQKLMLAAAMICIVAACILFLALFQRGNQFLNFPIAIGLCILLEGMSGWMLQRQSRRRSIRADDLMVRWLGRSQVCQGLHELADLSRTPTRRRWGDLSLVERINRICGIHVPSHDHPLTLVR